MTCQCPSPPVSGLGCRAPTWMAKQPFVGTVPPLVERPEQSDAGLGDNDPEATENMAIDERSHGLVFMER
jgi:hypothetical protein